MASNGYIRRCCTGCFFYYNCQDGHFCRFHSPSVLMLHISALDYDRSHILRSSYDSSCPHFIDREFVFEKLRSHFLGFFVK